MNSSRYVWAVLLLSTLPWISGCVLPDEIAHLQKDVADVQQQLRRVEEGQTDLERRLDLAESEVAEADEPVTREDLADVHLRLEQLARQVAVGTERMSDLDQRLDRFSQDLQRTQDLTRYDSPATSAETPADSWEAASDGQPQSPPPGAAPPTAFPDPEALYNTAYADFSKGNYALAVGGFREYQQRFPDSALADNALYWIAECRFSQGDYGGAVTALDDLLGRYPDSDKAPAANLKKALAFQEQNQIGQAIIQYRYVASAFPDTDEARLARDKLSGLGAAPN